MKRQYLIVAAALIVSACTTSQSKEPEFNLSGYPPAFRDGYMDGCNTTRLAASAKRDEARFKEDSMYAAGWRDGFDICSKKKYK